MFSTAYLGRDLMRIQSLRVSRSIAFEPRLWWIYLVSTCQFFCIASYGVCQRPTVDEDDIGVAYISQSIGMECYVARVVGEEDDDVGERAAFSQFEAIYCYYKPPNSNVPQERFERTSVWDTWEGKTRDVNERVLKVTNHEWIERNGTIFDAKTKHPETDVNDTFTPVERFDPLFLPISSTLSMRFGWAKRDNLSSWMPAGKLYDRTRDDKGNDVGVWYRGKPKVIGLQEIHFDPNHGMPVKSTERIKRRGLVELDEKRPRSSTELYSTTTTEWKQFKGGELWLPVSIESEQVTRGRCSFSVKIEWWIDDEVPLNIFEFDDFKLATIRMSRLNKLIEARKQGNIRTTE